MLNTFTSFPPSSKAIIAGEFNINMLQPSKRKNMLTELMQQYNFSSIVDTTTTFAGTLLDHFWIRNINEDFAKFVLLDTYWSDHLAVSLQVQF